MGKGQVAGILQCLGCLFRAVSGRAPAVQQLGPARDLLRAAAVKRGFQIDGPAVQGSRHGQHLEGGPGLIAVREHPVPPLLQPGLAQLLRIALPEGGIFFASFRAGKILGPQFLQLCRDSGICHGLVVVGIKVSQGGHGQDLPGLAVHNQAEGSVLHIVAGHGLLKPVFQAPLNGGIQGQNHIAAPGGLHQILIGIGHIHFVVALCCHNFSGLPGKEAVIGSLYPFTALAGYIGKADDLGRQASVRVASPGGGLQVDSGDLLPGYVGPDFIGNLSLNASRHLLIPEAGIPALLQNPLGVLFQEPSQKVGKLWKVRPGLLQLVGIQVDILHANGGSQNIHIPVIHRPPL